MRIVFILLPLLTFGLTCLFIKFAQKGKFLDVPNERSSHTIPTPRGGGLAFVLVFYLAILSLYILNDIESRLFKALLPGILLVIVGLIDDIFTVKPIFRFGVQSIVAIAALFFLGGLNQLDFGFVIINNHIALSIVAVFGFVWFINLYNFLDGIDGYAAVQGIFVAIALYYLTGSIVALIVTLATLGFLPWNWQKAKIFMGDVGSTLLGYIIVVLGIYYQNENSLSLVSWLILTSLFWFDATYTLILRLRNKEKLSEAHRKHFYQRLVRSGWSHQRTVLLGLIVNVILFGITAVFYCSFPDLVLIAFLLTLLVLFAWSKFIDRRMSFKEAS